MNMVKLKDLKEASVETNSYIHSIGGTETDIRIHFNGLFVTPDDLWVCLPPERMGDNSQIRHINVGERKGKKLVCVVFKDGTHIIKECQKEDEFDINVGVALCLMEKLYSSNTQFHKLVKNKLTDKSKELLEKWEKDDKTRATNTRSAK